jgi:hypothetical protein
VATRRLALCWYADDAVRADEGAVRAARRTAWASACSVLACSVMAY